MGRKEIASSSNRWKYFVFIKEERIGVLSRKLVEKLDIRQFEFKQNFKKGNFKENFSYFLPKTFHSD